jgi:signal transduction histidine kinase
MPDALDRREPAWPRRALRRLFGPIRMRATLLATLMLAGALGLGSEGLLEVLRSNLEHSREEIALARARDLASLATSGQLRSPISVLDEGTAVAQLVDLGRGVVAATPNVSSTAPLVGFLPPAARPTARSIDRLVSGPAGRYRVVALPLDVGGRPMAVYVGVGLDTVDHAIDLLSVALALGLPVLVVVGGLAIWVGVGRALRPVERLRREMAAISGGNLHERVSAPKSGDEIDRLAVTMNSMLNRLETASATERRFTADASHELRSPLAAMRAQLETARAYPETVDWLTVADEVLADQTRVERLVGDLLLLARLDGGEGTPKRLPVRLRDVVDEEVRRRPAGGRVAVAVELSTGGDALGDASQLSRMVRNLLDNAERHASSTVTVALVERGGELVLRVGDDGPGIAPADRARIFERFTRLDDARIADDGGSGLGLAIVRDIVAAHGGTVAVVDSAAGTCLEARLPVVTS